MKETSVYWLSKAKDWRDIEAWDMSIANDPSFSTFTRKRAAFRADVARVMAEECEQSAKGEA